MVVLKEVSIDILDRMAPAIRQGMRSFGLTPLVLSTGDLNRSTDVFPVKFLHMQKHHCVICGSDVLSGIAISRDHLRLRCEQEIKNLMLRLRRFYLQRRQRPEAMERTLDEVVPPFMANLSVLIELKTGEATTDVVDAAEAAGLPGAVLRELLALGSGQLKPDGEELRRLYGAFMETVQQAAEIVDSL